MLPKECEEIRKSCLDLLKIKCATREIPFAVMDAIITVESGWNPWAVRYESGFIYTLTPAKFAKLNGISQETEKMLQKSSWGLGQVMGGTARGIGYSGPITRLCLPEINIEWACHVFGDICAKYHNTEASIAAYNAGSARKDDKGKYVNQGYVDKVLAAMQRVNL